MKRKLSLLTLIIASIAATAYAETEAHHGSPFGLSFWFSVFNFVVLCLAMYFALKKPAVEFFRKRATTTRLEVDKAKKYYDDAQSRFKEIDTRLSQADLEAKKLLESIKHDGELEKQQIVRHAREMAMKIKLDSERIIGQELKRAQEILKAETVNLAAELATKQIESSISSEDQKALSGEFIGEMKSFSKV